MLGPHADRMDDNRGSPAGDGGVHPWHDAPRRGAARNRRGGVGRGERGARRHDAHARLRSARRGDGCRAHLRERGRQLLHRRLALRERRRLQRRHLLRRSGRRRVHGSERVLRDRQRLRGRRLLRASGQRLPQLLGVLQRPALLGRHLHHAVHPVRSRRRDLLPDGRVPPRARVRRRQLHPVRRRGPGLLQAAKRVRRRRRLHRRPLRGARSELRRRRAALLHG